MEKLKNFSLSVVLFAFFLASFALLVEGASFLYFEVKYRLLPSFRGQKPVAEVDYRVAAFPDSEKAWARAYFAELDTCDRPARQSNMVWHPYVYWRRHEFQGKWINVDARGVRKTANPACAGKKQRIFFFGGSTAWGIGAPDEGTIPSALSKELNSPGEGCYEITNFGESGYVSTQSVITLQRELQRGNVPDAVIFYDGVNDVYAAYQNGEPGVPNNEENRVKEFNSLFRREPPARQLLSSSAALLKNTNTYKMFAAIRQRLLNGRVALRRVTNHASIAYTGKELEGLARGVVDTYRANIRIVGGLGREYRFQSAFFWQPMVFFAGHLSPYEAEEAKKEVDLEPMFRAVYGMVSRYETLSAKGEFFDIQKTFAEKSGPLYLDFCHVKQEGNVRLAHEIAQRITAGREPILTKDPH